METATSAVDDARNLGQDPGIVQRDKLIFIGTGKAIYAHMNVKLADGKFRQQVTGLLDQFLWQIAFAGRFE